MTRLALKMGAEDRTLAGLTGLGDLVLTCTDNQSRNRRFGLLLGQGKSPEEAKTEIAQVVEGEGAAGDGAFPLCRHHDDGMVLHLVIVTIDCLKGSLYLRRTHIGQETQSSHVDTHDGEPFRPHPAGCLEEGAVASHGDDKVHIEVVIIEDTVGMHVNMQILGEKVMEFLVHTDLRLPLREEGQHFLYGSRFLGLIDVAEDGKP